MSQARTIPEGIRAKANNTASTIDIHLVVIVSAANADSVKLPAAVTEDVYGVTMAAIAVGDYGDIQIRGLAVCTAAAAITKGARLMMDTAGKVLTWAANAGSNAAVVGIAQEDAAGNNSLLEVELAGPAVSRQG